MTLTSFDTGFPVNVEWSDVHAFKADPGRTWLKMCDGRIVCVRESMREIETANKRRVGSEIERRLVPADGSRAAAVARAVSAGSQVRE